MIPEAETPPLRFPVPPRISQMTVSLSIGSRLFEIKRRTSPSVKVLSFLAIITSLYLFVSRG